jgi:hypothetical protein
MKKPLLLVAVILSATSALADDIRLGQPAYGGTGCPQGSASAALSPDQKTLSILFDQYLVEAGKNNGRTVDRKSCNIAIPVHVPQGYSISLFKVDYRGFNSLPQGARSRFNVSYFFAGQSGPTFSKDFYGPQNQDYFISNDVVAASQVWSPCGADTNLRVNSDLMTQTNGYRENTLSTVDSADIKAGLVYHVQWRRCQ